MNQALWVSKTGLDAQQMRMAVVANNLANVNTTGFKQGRVVFEDLLYAQVKQPGGQSSQDTRLPTGLSFGTGVNIVASEKLFTQGTLDQTGQALDVAINGRGFLQVRRPDGELAYTRAGKMNLNDQGELVTPSGYRLEPVVTIPVGAQNISIGKDGTVTVEAARTDGTLAGWHARACRFREPVRPAGDWRKPVCRNGRKRHADSRYAWA